MQRSSTKHPSAPLTLEHYLAAVFNQLELLTDLISAGKIQHVIDLYHQHWLHRSVYLYSTRDPGIVFTFAYFSFFWYSGAEVKVQLNEAGSENREVPARIIGIDEYGFLRVSLISGTSADGECRTVHPDGNSFDMFHGLLVPKLWCAFKHCKLMAKNIQVNLIHIFLYGRLCSMFKSLSDHCSHIMN